MPSPDQIPTQYSQGVDAPSTAAAAERFPDAQLPAAEPERPPPPEIDPVDVANRSRTTERVRVQDVQDALVVAGNLLVAAEAWADLVSASDFEGNATLATVLETYRPPQPFSDAQDFSRNAPPPTFSFTLQQIAAFQEAYAKSPREFLGQDLHQLESVLQALQMFSQLTEVGPDGSLQWTPRTRAVLGESPDLRPEHLTALAYTERLSASVDRYRNELILPQRSSIDEYFHPGESGVFYLVALDTETPQVFSSEVARQDSRTVVEPDDLSERDKELVETAPQLTPEQRLEALVNHLEGALESMAADGYRFAEQVRIKAYLNHGEPVVQLSYTPEGSRIPATLVEITPHLRDEGYEMRASTSTDVFPERGPLTLEFCNRLAAESGSTLNLAILEDREPIGDRSMTILTWGLREPPSAPSFPGRDPG